MTNSGDGDASSESSGTGRVLSKHDFAATTSQYRRDRMSDLKQEEKRIEYDLTVSPHVVMSRQHSSTDTSRNSTPA